MRTLTLGQASAQPWRNGGGLTRELLAWPRTDDWWLRISVAEIHAEGPFSVFAGLQRWFAVLRGDGVLLRFGEDTRSLGPTDAPLAFDGADAPRCELPGGPTQDLNLMLRSDCGSGRMDRAAEGQAWVSNAPLRALYCLDAAWLQIDDQEALKLAADTLAWHEDAAGQRWRLHGGGIGSAEPVRALWMDFTPRQP